MKQIIITIINILMVLVGIRLAWNIIKLIKLALTEGIFEEDNEDNE